MFNDMSSYLSNSMWPPSVLEERNNTNNNNINPLSFCICLSLYIN